jgi:hypothetical protein
MYAPLYRQVSLAGLQLQLSAGVQQDWELAYRDVEEAWESYLRDDNHGRGVVFIAHSQGTFMLRALIRRVIDVEPALRRKIVGAILLGGNVTTARGRATGGDAHNIPVCTRQGEFGCITAFSSFSSDPPPDSILGRTQNLQFLSDEPRGPSYQVACTDPPTVSGYTGPFGVTLPSRPFPPGLIYVARLITWNGPPPSADTAWVEPIDRFTGGCREIGGAHVLRYEPTPGSRRPNPAPSAAWGTHVVDTALGLDEWRVPFLASEITNWRNPRIRLARRCARGRLVVRLAGPDVYAVESARLTAAGRRLGLDSVAPFSRTLRSRRAASGRNVRITARVSTSRGSAQLLHLARTVKGC